MVGMEGLVEPTVDDDIAKIEECHHERMEPSQSRGYGSMRIVEEEIFPFRMISLTSQVHYDVVPQSLSREQTEVCLVFSDYSRCTCMPYS